MSEYPRVLSSGAATFMILGNLCTRGCGFLLGAEGSPASTNLPSIPNEPANVAEMAAR